MKNLGVWNVVWFMHSMAVEYSQKTDSIFGRRVQSRVLECWGSIGVKALTLQHSVGTRIETFV